MKGNSNLKSVSIERYSHVLWQPYARNASIKVEILPDHPLFRENFESQNFKRYRRKRLTVGRENWILFV